MCGDSGEVNPSTFSVSRVGARVDFFSGNGSGRTAALGTLIFLDPSTPDSQRATHVQFTPGQDVTIDDPILVSIHMTGDLTKSAQECGLFQQFCIGGKSWGPSTLYQQQQQRSDKVEAALERPLLLGIGGDGIMGRRASLVCGVGSHLCGDGIVGFNSMLPLSTAV